MCLFLRSTTKAIVTIDTCYSEKLSDLNIDPPDNIEKNTSRMGFPNKTFQLDTKAVQMAC